MEAVNALVARFTAPDSPPELETHILGSLPLPGSFAELVLRYLESIEPLPRSLAALGASLSALGEEEEELASWTVAEGLAVTSASDGWWVLFVEPEHDA